MPRRVRFPQSAAGSMRSNAPSSSSVITYMSPSGPCRTSRILWCRSDRSRSRRSSSSLSLTTTRSSAPVRGISPTRALPTNRLPFQVGKLVARVEREPGRRDRRQPQNQRLLDTFAERRRRNPRAVVVAAEAELRPAVVAPGQQQIDLVAAVRAVLGVQHGAGRGVHREAELVTMAVREDLGPRAGLADERVAGRRLAVVAQPQDFAIDVPKVLGRVVERRARRHVEQAVVAECEP